MPTEFSRQDLEQPDLTVVIRSPPTDTVVMNPLDRRKVSSGYGVNP